MTRTFAPVDPFDLPEWLGEDDVTWTTESGLRRGYDVAGTLTAEGRTSVPCDLLAVDEAYPVAVADEATRHDAHQAWRHGQVLVVEIDGRVTLAVPGTAFTADLVLDAMSRLAKAVGASPDHYSVRLRIGTSRA
ncbi:MAG: hypothetical protein WBP61_04300 [Nocardioides sp.]